MTDREKLVLAVETLKVYADREIWDTAHQYGVECWFTQEDNGKTAREALAAIGPLDADPSEKERKWNESCWCDSMPAGDGSTRCDFCESHAKPKTEVSAPRECCANGDFDSGHECLKEPPSPREWWAIVRPNEADLFPTRELAQNVFARNWRGEVIHVREVLRENASLEVPEFPIKEFGIWLNSREVGGTYSKPRREAATYWWNHAINEMLKRSGPGGSK